MAKKSVKAKQESLKSSKPKQPTAREVQLMLIENFVNLQKVLTNLSVKFDALSDNISKLLQLFEISAKAFLKKEEESFSEDRDLIKKLDTLLEQNKLIAKGLTLIEERIRHKIQPEILEEISEHEGGEKPKIRPKPLPRL